MEGGRVDLEKNVNIEGWKQEWKRGPLRARCRNTLGIGMTIYETFPTDELHDYIGATSSLHL